MLNDELAGITLKSYRALEFWQTNDNEEIY